MHADTAPQTIRDGLEVTLVDGQVAHLRPMRPQETAPLIAVFDGMSDLSRARRYLTGMPHLPPRVLRRLTDVGGRDHVAWLATIDGQPAGVARYVAVDGCLVDVAFEVVDRFHRRGLGTVLLDVIATAARTHGFASVTATVHPANVASLRMLRRMGLRLQLSDGLLEGQGLSDEAAWHLAKVFRDSASPEVAAAYLEHMYPQDVSALLPHIDAPALVLHYRGDRLIRFRGGQELAAGLPHATLVALDGQVHLPDAGDLDVIEQAIVEHVRRHA